MNFISDKQTENRKFFPLSSFADTICDKKENTNLRPFIEIWIAPIPHIEIT